MQSSIKSSSSLRNRQLQAQFLALITQEVGEGVFKDCEKEQFQDLETQKAGQDFYLQEEESSTVPSIKTAPFHKFINLGIQKEAKEHGQLDELTVDTYNFAYGCNDGKTIETIQGKLCKAIGVNIFFGGFIYPCQADRNDLNFHSYQICYLSYDSNSQLLYSGSNGKNSQIIEWRYSNEKPYLSFVRKVALPSSTLGVNFTFKLSGQLSCISKWSLHKQSELFSFDVETTKRTRYELPLGKVMGLCESLDVYIINQKGLHMLAENKKGFELIKITQSEQFATAIDKIGSEYLIVGMLDGSVQIICPKDKALISKVSITDSPILAVKMIGKHRFIATNSSKQIIFFQMDSKYKNQKIIENFKMTEISRNIQIVNNGFVCLLKGGKLESFQLSGNQKLSTTTEKIQEYMNYGYTNEELGQIICYNKVANKYIYSAIRSDILVIFQMNQNKTVQKIKKVIVSNPLSYFDSHGTIIACVGVIKKKQPSQTIRQTLQFYDFTISKSVCIIEELPFSDCRCIKFNEDGDKLAIGFSNGKIVIYNTNNLNKIQEVCLTQEQKVKDFNHNTPIQTLIWSKDGRYLKTLSQDNLLFYGIKNNSEIYELVVYDGKKGEKQAMKNAISQADWSEMGKFNWRASKIWSRANSVQQYTHIVQSGGYLFASLDSGDMQVFANPAEQEYFALCRWFTCGYRMKVVEGVEGTVLLIAGRGSLICVNIR